MHARLRVLVHAEGLSARSLRGEVPGAAGHAPVRSATGGPSPVGGDAGADARPCVSSRFTSFVQCALRTDQIIVLPSRGTLGREYVARCPGWTGCPLGLRLGAARTTTPSSVQMLPKTLRRTRTTWSGTLVGRGFAAFGSWSTRHDTRLRRPTRTPPSRTTLSTARYVLNGP